MCIRDRWPTRCEDRAPLRSDGPCGRPGSIRRRRRRDSRDGDERTSLWSERTSENLLNHRRRDDGVVHEAGMDEIPCEKSTDGFVAVSYTHLRAHETVLDLV